MLITLLKRWPSFSESALAEQVAMGIEELFNPLDKEITFDPWHRVTCSYAAGDNPVYGNLPDGATGRTVQFFEHDASTPMDIKIGCYDVSYDGSYEPRFISLADGFMYYLYDVAAWQYLTLPAWHTAALKDDPDAFTEPSAEAMATTDAQVFGEQ
jgi:hypothetical protein